MMVVRFHQMEKGRRHFVPGRGIIVSFSWNVVSIQGIKIRVLDHPFPSSPFTPILLTSPIPLLHFNRHSLPCNSYQQTNKRNLPFHTHYPLLATCLHCPSHHRTTNHITQRGLPAATYPSLKAHCSSALRCGY